MRCASSSMSLVAILSFCWFLPAIHLPAAAAARFGTQSHNSLCLSWCLFHLWFLLAISFGHNWTNFSHLTISCRCLLCDFESSNLQFETSLWISKQEQCTLNSDINTKTIGNNMIITWISNNCKNKKQYYLPVSIHKNFLSFGTLHWEIMMLLTSWSNPYHPLSTSNSITHQATQTILQDKERDHIWEWELILQ